MTLPTPQKTQNLIEGQDGTTPAHLRIHAKVRRADSEPGTLTDLPGLSRRSYYLNKIFSQLGRNQITMPLGDSTRYTSTGALCSSFRCGERVVSTARTPSRSSPDFPARAAAFPLKSAATGTSSGVSAIRKCSLLSCDTSWAATMLIGGLPTNRATNSLPADDIHPEVRHPASKLTLIQDNHSIRQRHSLPIVVSDMHHRGLFARANTFQFHSHLYAQARIKVRYRFI